MNESMQMSILNMEPLGIPCIPQQLDNQIESTPIKRTKKGSKYDEYFTKVGEAAECRICGTKVSWTKKGGTNSLRLHLSTRHKEESDKLMIEGIESKRRKGLIDTPPPNFTLNSVLNGEVKLENIIVQPGNFMNGSIGNWNPPPQPVSEIDHSVIAMICREHLPINMIGGIGFANFMRLAAPRFDLRPVYHYTQRVLPAIVFNMREKIRNDFSYQNKLTFSVDIFTNSMKYFVAIQAFHINHRTMIPKKMLIDYRVLPSEITDFNIDSVYEIIHRNVNIGNRNITVTFDSKLLKGRHVPESEGSGILSSFDQIFDTVIRNIFNNCGLLETQLRMARMENHKHFPTPDDPLTWKSIIDLFLLHEKPSFLNPMEEETYPIACEILREIRDTISSIHHQHYPTASIIIPTLRVISSRIEQMNVRFGTNNFVRMATDSFKSMCTECENNNILKTASFLDPRFKDRYFTESHQYYMEDEFVEMSKRVMDEVYPEEDIKPTELSSFDLFLQTQGPHPPQRKTLLNELEEYQNEEQNSRIDPNEFWMINENKYPILKRLAAEFLAIPASTFGAKELTEWGETMSPFTIENKEIHENLVFCSGNIDEYALY